MRGKAVLAVDSRLVPGITPAYAGKRQLPVLPAGVRPDHPRLCGEKIMIMLISIIPQGSPPPMRGKVLVDLIEKLEAGITPAYAGKCCFVASSVYSQTDHPRLCGEKVVRFKYRLSTVGSPPPMRGKVPHSFVHHLSTRITPAYAGKSE